MVLNDTPGRDVAEGRARSDDGSSALFCAPAFVHQTKRILSSSKVHYRIEHGVLVLEVVLEDLPELLDVVRAALHDPAASPRMPLLIDMRREAAIVRYDDVSGPVGVLELMRDVLGPRWAILTRPSPVRMVIFLRIEALEVAMFADEEAALTWLRGQP